MAGPVLADDATLLMIDWHDAHRGDRTGSGGADQTRASGAPPH
jgi:hypothetical protein